LKTSAFILQGHGLVGKQRGEGMGSGKELPVVSILLQTPAKIIIDKGQVDGREEI